MVFPSGVIAGEAATLTPAGTGFIVIGWPAVFVAVMIGVSREFSLST